MAVSKTSEKKPVAKKAAVAEKTVAKATMAKAATAKKASPKKTAKAKVSPEQHYKMVEMAAYFIAERNDFSGSPSDYWAEAEAQIKTMLAK